MSNRFTMDLPDKLFADVNSIVSSEVSGINTKAGVFKHSLILYKALIDEIAKGNTVSITRDGKVVKDVIMSV